MNTPEQGPAIRVSDPRPRILDLIPQTGHVVIEASAGTGKTYTLESLVLHLLQQGQVTLDQILVVTFTEKATEELRGRLYTRIERLLQDSPSDWNLQPEEIERLQHAKIHFNSGTLSTIHGFCRKILAENAFLQRRLFDEELVDSEEQFHRCLRTVLRTAIAASTFTGRTLRAHLGASGSLKDLADLAYKLSLEQGIVVPSWQPKQRNAAAARVPALCSQAQALLLAPIRSLHGQRITGAFERHLSDLSKLSPLLGQDASSFEGHDRLHQWARRQINKQPLLGFLSNLPANSGEAREVRDELCGALEDLASFACSRSNFLAQSLSREVQERLTETKSALGQHDFDDLLTLLSEGLNGTAGQELLKSLRERYRVVLIDESQDTDEIQWSIFRTIFFDSPQHRLFLVGDPKQSIYGFRNADVQTYFRAKEEVLESQGTSLNLTHNYRSTSQLIQAQNEFFREAFSGDLDYPSVTCGRPDLRTLDDSGQPLAPIGLLRLDNGTPPSPQMAGAIALEIRHLVGHDPIRLEDRRGSRVVCFSDIQILARSAADANEAGKALAKLDIPYEFYRQEGLYTSPEAEELTALFLAIANPEEPSLRGRAWLTPFFGIPLRVLPACHRVGSERSTAIVSQLYRWHELARNGNLPRLFQSILDESGVVRRALFDGCRERQVTNYRHLLEDMLSEGTTLGRDLQELPKRFSRLRATLGRSGQERNLQRLIPSDDSVQIMTLHKAKGLESPIVFITGGWTEKAAQVRSFHRSSRRFVNVGRVWPSLRPLVDWETASEFQRLAYVGVTRAQHRLYLPYGGPKPKQGTLQFPLSTQIERLLGNPSTARLLEVLPARNSEPSNSLKTASLPQDLTLIGRPMEPRWTEETSARLKSQHRAVFLTSYTQLSRERVHSGSKLFELEPGSPQGMAGELPGGPEIGVFLHAVLESIDFEVVAGAESPEELFAESGSHALYSKLARRHRVEEQYGTAVFELIFACLRAPVLQAELNLRSGLSSITQPTREMEFLFPIAAPARTEAPDRFHSTDPRGRDRSQLPFPVGPGFVQGVVDLVFELSGRTYIVDWKSDRRSEWSEEGLGDHISKEYDLQVRLYSLAVGRMLSIESSQDYEDRFGGLLYCFLRGMRVDSPNRGVHFIRPTWEEFSHWNQELPSLSRAPQEFRP